MARLIICRGLSGSGKSTWASAQVGYVVVSRDALRVALFGSDGPDYYQSPDLRDREDYITTVEHEAIRRALTAGRDVISDNTNIEMRYVNPIAKIGYACDADVEVKCFEVTLNTALGRNAYRAAEGGRNVPKSTIEKQFKAFKPNAALPERPVVRPYTGTPGKPKAFMCDIDGTLADMKNYRKPYDLNVEVDEPRFGVIEVVNGLAVSSELNLKTGALKPRYKVILMSGRKEDCRQATQDWLNSWDVHYDYLLMRKSDDNRSDNLIKHDLFWEHVAPNFDVQFVFDDRNQVVDMWRKMGLDCFQVAEGEF